MPCMQSLTVFEATACAQLELHLSRAVDSQRTMHYLDPLELTSKQQHGFKPRAAYQLLPQRLQW